MSDIQDKHVVTDFLTHIWDNVMKRNEAVMLALRALRIELGSPGEPLRLTPDTADELFSAIRDDVVRRVRYLESWAKPGEKIDDATIEASFQGALALQGAVLKR